MIRKSLLVVLAVLSAQAANAWTIQAPANPNSSAKYQTYLPSGNSQTGSHVNEYLWIPVGTQIAIPIYGPGTTMHPTDPSQSWVQYEINVVVNGSTVTRDIIVFRNPQNAQIAGLLNQFQSALAAGRKLVLLRNQTRTGYAITNGWEGFGTQNSFEILPGDQVQMYFR